MYCEKLKILPESLGECKALTSLNLESCYGLKKLPNTIGELKNLQELYLAGCSNLIEFPEVITKLTQLTSLDISATNMESLPESLGECKALTSLKLAQCRELKTLPAALYQLPLKKLSIAGCKQLPLDTVSTICENLTGLEELDLRGLDIKIDREQLKAQLPNCKIEF